MAKKNKISSGKKDIDISLYQNSDKVSEVDIGDYNTTNMQIYGANINLARMFPDLRDGLKPVERRVLYSMYEFTKAINQYKKVQKIIGDCMGTIHPHGDTSINDVVVRLSQPWENLVCPIDGWGNFGDVKGSGSGAARYIEAKLSKYSLDCFFSDYDPKIIEMKPSYQNEFMEPEYFVTKYPNMLMSISTGLGFGIACGIPTYNLEEILQTTIKLIKGEEVNTNLIPDMPTGCTIIDEGQFSSIFETGRGSFRMRADIQIIPEKNIILITSLPYQVDLLKVKTKIKEMVEAKEIVGFKEIRDYSADRIHLELEFKQGADLQHIVNLLYKKTNLQKTFAVIMYMIYDLECVQYSVRSALLKWIDVRRTYKNKFYINKLVKLEERKHFLDILLFILNKDNAEKTMKIIKKSDTSEIVDKLVNTYGITSMQAKIIANMKMKEFSKSAYKKYKEEAEELPNKINKIKKILKSNTYIDKEICSELEEGIKKYNTPRRCKVIKLDEEESEYSNTNNVIVFTKNGYIKKLLTPVKSIGELGEGDTPNFMLTANNRDTLIIFDSEGYVYPLEVGKINQSELKDIGYNLGRYISIRGEVVHVVTKSKIDDNSCLCFVTKQGMIKKTPINNYTFKVAVIAVLLNKGDKLIDVIDIKDDNIDVVVYTHMGMGLRFNTSEFSSSGRTTKGCGAILLSEGDYVYGIAKLNKSDRYITVITSTGNVKRCPLSIFPAKNRRSEAINLIGLKGKERLIYLNGCNTNNIFHIYLQKNGIVEIPVKMITTKYKYDTGDKMIPVRKGDSIVKIIKS